MQPELQRLLAQAERLTGKRYPKLHVLIEKVEADPELLRELFLFLGDIESEVMSAKKNGNRDAWQRGKVY